VKALFDSVSYQCSKLTTVSYSTSFSLGIKLFSPSLRPHIYAIYGFVRFADEIVDTFHDYDKKKLLERFKTDTYTAIDEKISLNPILNSFQKTVNEFGIDMELIDAFLHSMAMDLNQLEYDRSTYEEYILGSAEVVGLMCLKVFCLGDTEKYNTLKDSAMRLGAAFQKINFLRDLKDDTLHLGRVYFPQLNSDRFDELSKMTIEKEIQEDFAAGLEGIHRLPSSCRLGVYLAYVYYYSLFRKIQNTPSTRIMEERIRIPNSQKYAILAGSYLRFKMHML
jgi:15-cis-phytoene synthase